MLFNLVSRQLPFNGTDQEILQQHFHAEPPSLHALVRGEQTPPPEIDLVLEQADDLVSRLMSKDLHRRPDARSVASELSNLESKFGNEKTSAGIQMPILLEQVVVGSGPGLRRTSTTVLPRKPEGLAAPPTSEFLAALKQPKKDRKWLYAVMLLLLLLIGGGVVLSGGEKTEVVPPPPVSVVEKQPEPVDAGGMIAKVEPPPAPVDDLDLSPLPEMKPGTKTETKNPPPLVLKKPEKQYSNREDSGVRVR